MRRIPDATLAELRALVVAWVEDQERVILEQGDGLTEPELRLATRAGVLHPGRVRLLALAKTPRPEEKTLRRAAPAFGFVSEFTDGLTAGYGFLVRRSRRQWPRPGRPRSRARAPAHTWLTAHVAQYERFGRYPRFSRQVSGREQRKWR